MTTAQNPRALTRAQQKTVASFTPLAWKVARKCYLRMPPKYRNIIDLEDLVGQAAIGICYAVPAFDENRGRTLKTWCWACAKWFINKYLERIDDRLPPSDCLGEQPIADDSSPIELEKIDARDEWESMLRMLDGREQYVLTEVFRRDREAREIARDLRCSKSLVSSIKLNALDRIREVIEGRKMARGAA